jgi:phage shock protein C
MQTTPRLTRSRGDRMVAGVAAGVARYLNIDPTVVRLIFVLLTLSGPGAFIYLVLWVVMPQDAPAAGGAPGQVFVSTGETVRLRLDPQGEPEQEVPINNVGGAQGAPGTTGGTAGQGGKTLGYLLLGLGVFITLQMIWPGFAGLLFPAALVAAGVWLLRRGA